MCKCGKFIVIEGLEGAGKTTLCQKLAQQLNQYGFQELLLREPGGTVLAEQIRDLIQHGVPNEPLHNTAELLLLYAARVQLVEQVIKPALASGTWVISDRHELSTQAYQGGGRGLDEKLLQQLRHLLLGPFQPDLTFYLDITPEQGLQRIQGKRALDRIEQESLPFFQRTRQRYLELVRDKKNVITLDASQTDTQVCQMMNLHLTAWLNQNRLVPA